MSRFVEYRNSFETRVRQSLRWSPGAFEPSSEASPEKVARANFMYRVVLLSHFALVIIYVAMLLSAVIYHIGGYEVGALAFASAPIWTVVVLYGTLGLGVLKSLGGVGSTIKSSRCGSLTTMFLSFLLLILSFALLIFVILRSGGSGVIAQEVSPTTFADEVLANMVRFALADLNRWKSIQDNAFISECCGINLKALYGESLFGIVVPLDDLNNGDICTANGAITSITGSFPEYGDEVQEDVDLSLALQGYFCEDQLITELRNLAIGTIPVLVLPMLLETLAAFGTTRLLYHFSVEEGGMKRKHNKVGPPKPILEETILKKAGYKSEKPLRF